jgi:hypothetical protein
MVEPSVHFKKPQARASLYRLTLLLAVFHNFLRDHPPNDEGKKWQ